MKICVVIKLNVILLTVYDLSNENKSKLQKKIMKIFIFQAKYGDQETGLGRFYTIQPRTIADKVSLKAKILTEK